MHLLARKRFCQERGYPYLNPQRIPISDAYALAVALMNGWSVPTLCRRYVSTNEVAERATWETAGPGGCALCARIYSNVHRAPYFAVYTSDLMEFVTGRRPVPNGEDIAVQMHASAWFSL